MSARAVGNVTMEFRSPDTLHMVWKGSFGETEADGLLAFTEELRRRPDVPHIVLYIDVRGAGGIDARARKKIAEITRARPYLASAIVGASFPIRVAVELIVNAARLLVQDSAETRFFEDDESAHAWLAQVRAQLTAA